MKIRLLIPFLIILSLKISAQNIPLLGWHSYMNYTEGVISAEVGNKIYCATQHGLFFIDKQDLAITTLSKIDGLSDVQISTMRYDSVNDALLVAYTNGNMDLIRGNKIYNIPDIYRSFILGKKTINDIFFYNDKAYISCSFGIVVYDLKKMEVKETYSQIGAGGSPVEVNSVTVLNGDIYASTKNGILRASLSVPNLLDYNNWKVSSSLSTTRLVTFNNKVYGFSLTKIIDFDGTGTTWNVWKDSISNGFSSMEVCHEKMIISLYSTLITVDNNGQTKSYHKNNLAHVIMDRSGAFWLSVSVYGLLRFDGLNFQYFKPDCPGTYKSWAMEFYNGNLYSVPGSLTDGWSNTFTGRNYYYLGKDGWININYSNDTGVNKLYDITGISINPADNHIFLASFGKGIGEFVNDKVFKIYDESNSSLGHNAETSDLSIVQVYSLAFDADGNMWATNWAAQEPISKRDKKGVWKSYDVGSSNRYLSKIILDDYNQKWILMPLENAVIVFDETKPANQNYKKLTNSAGQGNLPGIVHSIAKDHDGKIWIGTEEGVAVFNDPSLVFTNFNFDAQKIWVDQGANSGYLLATEVVTAITVDGANNKWLGTKKGVWYVSADGTKVLKHFTTENSPMSDDYIRDIAINGQTGEVYFATNGGIVSYRNTATEGNDTYGYVYAFPNPVRPDYHGLIAVKGLVTNADVKITDVAGNLVYATKAQGGQVTWDGKNFNGASVKSGVYLVYSSSEDGSQKNVTKIMIIR